MATFILDTAVAECISEDALIHLKSYKYSSVDKSLISNYILKHYVGFPPIVLRKLAFANAIFVVEWLRKAFAFVACAEHGNATWVLLHIDKCDIVGDLYSGPSRTCMYKPNS